MSFLRIYPENDSSTSEDYTEFSDIREQMNAAGVLFERWEAQARLNNDSTQEEILKAYEQPVSKLMKDRGFATADVISVHSNLPNHPELRKKFLDEHQHSEDEARFFVDGSGLFYIHTSGRVFALLCERGDFINIPAGTKHWFDMGPRPLLKCIRTFTTPEGWVAEFTGSGIASRFPRFESLVPAGAV
jgi:1,2-dihydroxy-3-keto-5-methylthiopentene dioxygenase